MFLEIIVQLAIWSIAFELIGPFYFGKGTSDPIDVFAYCLGGLSSWIIWNRGNLFNLLFNIEWSIGILMPYNNRINSDPKS